MRHILDICRTLIYGRDNTGLHFSGRDVHHLHNRFTLNTALNYTQLSFIGTASMHHFNLLVSMCKGTSGPSKKSPGGNRVPLYTVH